jgi:resuscitation-promoting factor RpfB
MQNIRRYQPYIERFNRHPYALPLTTFLLLFFLSIAIFIGLNATTAQPSDAHIIELSIDNTRQSLPTRSQTVGEFIKRANIKLGPNDVVEPDKNTAIIGDDFKVNVYRARPVTIMDQGKRIQAYSAASTPRSVAEQAGLTVYPEDRLVSEVPDNFLRDGVLGEKVVIDRATPVNLNLYGSPEPTRTRARTVGELLQERGVKLAPDDSVNPSLETPIASDLQIFVTRSGIQIATVEEQIVMPVQVIEDSSLSFGTQATRQQGSPGRKTVTYEIKLENSREVGRRKIQEVTIVPPVTQIVARGPQGNFGNSLAQLRQCEAGGNYHNKSNPNYRGAYQFNYATWNNYAGYYDPADAPPAIQDQKATETYQRRGWQPWPACSQKLGLQDIYR